EFDASEGGLLGGQGRWGAVGPDHCHLHADEVCRELGKPLSVSIRPPGLDQNVLALHIACLPQPLAEALGLGLAYSGGEDGEEADAGDWGRRLRLDYELRREEAQGKRDDVSDDAVPHNCPLVAD